MALEKIEVNKEYINADNVKVKVLAIGQEKLFIRTERPSEYTQDITFALLSWIELPKQKKRCWLWDVNDSYGISKPSTYMDENGLSTTGRKLADKHQLIKKHENEFVEIEIE